MQVLKSKEKLGLSANESIDIPLFISIISLVSLGFIMVTSSSIEVADNNLGKPFHYAIHQGIYILVGIFLSTLAFSLKIDTYKNYARPILLLAIFFLVIVLVPGIGRTVNGSTRWLPLGIVAFQVSEFVKLAIILYLASYLDRLSKDEISSINSYFGPICLVAIISFLLLMEPDFGATVVVVTTCLVMLFLADAPLKYFAVLFISCIIGLATIAISAPYRLKRLTSFLNPWENQFDSGYQLTQSLIAFGRGEWFGLGLGSGIQKLFFLPESHTDFLFAVLAEELGLIGSLSVLILFIVFVYRGMKIGLAAKQKKQRFASYVAYGITLWIGLQAVVSIGVNTGILPTKGLTLPFMSYGGSSLVIVIMACGILLKINYEINKIP